MGAFVPTLQGKIDIALSNFAREYRNTAFIGERILPRVAVTKQSDKYWLFGKETLQLPSPSHVLRAAGAAAIELLQTISTDSYLCDDHAASRIIPDEERAGFEAGDVEQWSTRMVIDRLLLDEEDRIRVLVTDAAQYAAANKKTLSGTSQWSDLNNSDPIKDILAAKKQIGLIGQQANLMVINPDVYEQLQQHPKIKERFVNVTGGPLTLDNLRTLFGMEIVLAAAVKDSAGTLSYLWGKDVWIGYVTPTPSFADVSFGKTFVWTTAPGTAGGFGTEVNRVYPASRKADSVDVHFYYAHKLVAKDAGYLVISAVA